MKKSTTSDHKPGELYFNMFLCTHTLLLCYFFRYSFFIFPPTFSYLLTLVSCFVHTLFQPLLGSSHSFLFHSIYISFYAILPRLFVSSRSRAHFILAHHPISSLLTIYSCHLPLYPHLDPISLIIYDFFTYHIGDTIIVTYWKITIPTKSPHFDPTQIL